MPSKPVGILAADPLGPSMAGPARRSLALATQLGAVRPVELWYEGEPPGSITNVTSRPYAPDAWLKASEGYIAALIPSQFALKEHRVFDAPCIRIIDCTVPFPLETASLLIGAPVEEARQITRLQSWAINRAVSAGDYWLVSNLEQECWILGLLTSLGRISPALASDWGSTLRLIHAPYGMEPSPATPPDSARRTQILASLGLPANAPYVLWTGGMWPWMSPLTVVEAMPYVHEVYPDLHLLLPGAQSPHAEAPELPQAAAVRARISELNLGAFVHPMGWLSEADWPTIASGASLHLSAHRMHPETDLCYRTRYLEAIRWGKRLVITPGDPLGGQLQLLGCAVVAHSEHPEHFAEAMLEAFIGLEHFQQKPEGWESVEDFFSWRSSLMGLVEMLEQGPTPHPDGPWTPDMAGNPAAAPPTPTLLARAMNKLRRMTR